MPTGRLTMRRIRDVLRLRFAQGLSGRAILLLEPSQGVVKMLRLEVGLVLINDIKVGINRLNREKSTQPTSSPPAHYHIQSGDVL